MNVRAAAVILTDTKSLSRFSVMKFLSLNVQWSSVSRLPLLSLFLSFFLGALLLLLRITLPSSASLHRLASFSHSHAHFHVWALNIYSRAHTATGNITETHTYTHRGTYSESNSTDAPLSSILMDPIHSVTSGLICSSPQLLRGGGVNPTSAKWQTYKTVSGYFNVDAPTGNQHPNRVSGVVF